ncbi:hypothetical protein HDU87_007894 [Geranomyces variabilis]|uniref:N-acetyltransferase domain-containing protein n=1 Tax=Geranomyces variabilis TaxID=109894 RepID=A0AAD5TE40_9FUNG|nr:hypothetical protein HDU87_007894 [Geranomyces variabilis]
MPSNTTTEEKRATTTTSSTGPSDFAEAITITPPPLRHPPQIAPTHTLHTRRLLLRPATYTTSDITALNACLSDPECMTWWSTPPHTSLQQTATWLWGMVGSYGQATETEVIDDAGKKTQWVYPQPVLDLLIVERDSGRVVGKVGFYRPPEVGFILCRSAWGKGYATEALRAIIDAIWSGVFGQIRCDHGDGRGVRAIDFMVADVDPRNDGSLKVLRKLGFREVGRRTATFETHMGVCDSVDLRLDRPCAG